MNFCATEVNPHRVMAPWSYSSGARSYLSNDNFNGFGNLIVENYPPNPIHPATMPQTSSKSNEEDLQYNSGDCAVSSTVNIKMEDIRSRNMDFAEYFINHLIDSINGQPSEDSLSNGTSTSPEIPTYTSEDHEHNIAETAPILHCMLNKPAADIRMNGQNYLQNLEPPQILSTNSSPSQFQQPCQLSQHFSQGSQYQQCVCQHTQIQNGNQFQPYQQRYHYSTSANYFTPMLPTYQNQQQVGWPMGHMGPPMASTSQPAPPAVSISPTTTYVTRSPPVQISSASSAFVPPARKRANPLARAKSISAKKDDNANFHYCPVCQRPFKNKSNIKTHLRTHTKEKPYVCGICKKRFTQKAHLTKHVVIHQRTAC